MSGGAIAARDRWLEAALGVDGWLAARGDAGHDPHDLLASPLVRGLTLGSRWGAVAWTQLGKRSPFSFRGVLGVPRARNAKGIGLTLAAQVRLVGAVDGGGERAGGMVASGAVPAGSAAFVRERLERARGAAEWLYGAGVEVGGGVGWGYPFPWANRDFYAPAGTPSSVVTAFVGHALLDAAEAFGWGEARGYALLGAEFLRRSLNRIPGEGDTFCFSYTPLDRRGVHNASLLAASLLARVGRLEGDGSLLEEALRAARFTAAAQRPDGSWPYGITGRNTWVDSFHTGYTLVALSEVGAAAGVSEFDAVIERGLAYWERSFLVGPAVSFYPGEEYPVDLHAVAHAIITLVHFRDRVPGALERAGALADWCLTEMRDPAGFFYYQKHRRWRNRVAYVRWIQGWMLLALSELTKYGKEEIEGRKQG